MNEEISPQMRISSHLLASELKLWDEAQDGYAWDHSSERSTAGVHEALVEHCVLALLNCEALSLPLARFFGKSEHGWVRGKGGTIDIVPLHRPDGVRPIELKGHWFDSGGAKWHENREGLTQPERFAQRFPQGFIVLSPGNCVERIRSSIELLLPVEYVKGVNCLSYAEIANAVLSEPDHSVNLAFSRSY